MIEFIDPSWDKKYAENLKLSILLGVDSFSLSLLNTKNVVLAYHEYEWNISNDHAHSEIVTLANEIKRDSLYIGNYASFSFQIIPSLFAFLPTRLFDENNVNTYFEHLLGKGDDLKVKYAEYTSLDLIVIYKEHYFQHHLSKLLYPDKPSFPVFKTILPFLMEQDLHDTNIFCRISKNSLIVFVFRDKFFQFSNQFYCHQITDFQYFVLLVCNQFQLNPSLETLSIWGDCDEDSEVVIRLVSLFSRIKFLNAQWVISPDTKTRIVSESKVLEHLLVYSR
jgi:hypothetical protein